jgi:hypothetical protein
MSALMSTRRPPPARRARGESACPPRPEPEAGPTLDDVVSRTWEVLRATVQAACLVCGAELQLRHSAGAGVVGGRCDSCGSTLA